MTKGIENILKEITAMVVEGEKDMVYVLDYDDCNDLIKYIEYLKRQIEDYFQIKNDEEYDEETLVIIDANNNW